MQSAVSDNFAAGRETFFFSVRVVRFGLQAGFGKTPHYRSAPPLRFAVWSPLLHAEGGMFFRKSLPVALSKPHAAPGETIDPATGLCEQVKKGLEVQEGRPTCRKSVKRTSGK